MFVEQILVGPMENFSYLVLCEETRKAMVIDPAGEPRRLLGRLKELEGSLNYIVNTHGHYDHTAACVQLKRASGARVVAHELDAAEVPEVDLTVRDGDIIPLGTVQVHVLHTPGHSPGGICLFAEGHLFTGDTLFVGAVGRTDLQDGDFGTLLRSIKEKLLPLPPETVVWPGHDYGDRPSSTLARECRTNPFITDFILSG